MTLLSIINTVMPADAGMQAFSSTSVMPAKAGIQAFKGLGINILLDASVRWHDRKGCNREILS